MAKAAKTNSRGRGSKKAEDTQGRTRRVTGEAAGLALLVLSMLSGVALFSYVPSDPIFRMEPVGNAAGVIGAALAGGLIGLLGAGSVVVVAGATWLGGRLVLGFGLPVLFSRFWVGLIALTVSFASLPPVLHEIAPSRVPDLTGGLLGAWLVNYELLLLRSWGALIVNVFGLTVGVLSVAGVSTGRAMFAVGAIAAFLRDLLVRGVGGLVRAVRTGAAASIVAVRTGFSQLRAGAGAAQVWRERRARRARVAAAREPSLPAESTVSKPVSKRVADAVLPAAPAAAGEPHIVDHEEVRRTEQQPAQEAFRFRESSLNGPFELPDLSLLQTPPEASITYDRDSLLMNSRILEKKLMDFGVAGKVVRVHPGPVITMYEFEPAAGIKVNRIVSLSDDLAMALRALSIRIIAPLPGKSVVGIEVPNVDRETVYLRTLLESESYRGSESKLTLAMGKDIFGNSVDADLAKMPHLLVAGATGTGKSVFLNAILCSILYRATPNDCKFLLIDPKLLELSIYEGIPHLLAEVVTQPKRAAAALAGVVRKMEERYQMMSAVQVRNVDQFNKYTEEAVARGETHFRLKPAPGEEEGLEVELCRLPYIVVVIDELADLMVQVARDVEESLQRLAQMARAAGIHLILATQRPSVDVLTGVIKANFPARISFQVSSRTDSRTVLDQNGADHLLGQGDMLFLPPGTSRLQRVHGPFVTEKEVSEIVGFLKKQGQPEFDEGLIREVDETQAGGSSGDDVDDMLDQAIAVVAETRNASISYVQRRLKVGYNRAARMVEHMEREGMIGPQEGTKPREVFLRAPDSEE